MFIPEVKEADKILDAYLERLDKMPLHDPREDNLTQNTEDEPVQDGGLASLFDQNKTIDIEIPKIIYKS